MKNILELLEKSASSFPDKISFSDDIQGGVTYSDLVSLSKNAGSFFADKKIYKRAIAVYMNQSVNSLISAFGIVYSGNYYVIIDYKMPVERIHYILETLNPAAIICSEETQGNVSLLNFNGEICKIDEIKNHKADSAALENIRRKQIDTDPLYVLFTSGSTGKPKGTVVNHRNVLAYSEWFCDAFDINENSVFGNQTPFYFSMSVSDVYAAIRAAASLYIIPKKLFSFPVKLMECLNENKVNTIYWVPSALSIVANWKTFDFIKPEYVEKVLFAGEVMPTKQLNYWIKHLPGAMYANLFGPTETTDICCYYVVNREIPNTKPVPIGNSCNNCDCFIVNEDGREDVQGELYIRGSFVAPGYFNNSDKTNEVFVQNPLQNAYPEKVYKTGDIVKINEFGEMEYVSRKDFQIKHMGYRIELGEIEFCANNLDKIKLAVVVYDKSSDDIILIYQGKKFSDAELIKKLSGSIPNYMLPTKVIRIKEIPYNANGKIDRNYLLNNYKKYLEV